MTFLQPLLLFALPLIALPILIHLINQHRHRTIQWGAMMFLRRARRMTRGLAKLRYLLILLMRMLAIAGLVLAVSRPLASGWLGLTAGGAPDTTIVILDRSSSMEQQDLQTGDSKRSTALTKLSQLLTNLGRNTRLVLIENTSEEPQEIELTEKLADRPDTGPTSTSADIPRMLEKAMDYVANNETGRTDIWICSDLSVNDWNPDGGRWDAIRDGFAQRDGVRFYLLAYPDAPKDNLSVRVSGVHRREVAGQPELVMDLRLTRESESDDSLKVPLEFVINGARSTLEIEMEGPEYLRLGHTIPLDRQDRRGYGRVQLPNDGNPQDNVFHFVYAEPPTRRTVIVTDDENAGDLLSLAAGTPTDRSLPYETTVVAADDVGEIAWDEAALVIWHAPLPDGLVATHLQNFVNSGRAVIFFPPEEGDDGGELFATRWKDWQGSSGTDPHRVIRWRGDADLLSHTQNGSPLPVGQLSTFRFRELETDGARALAEFEGGNILLSRASTDDGAAYFCSTLPVASHSSLARDGIVFYVMVQRALSRGAGALGAARYRDAGSPTPDQVDGWKPVDELSEQILLSDRPYQAGIYDDGDRLVALNRPLEEDGGNVVQEESLDETLSGLDYTRIDDSVGSTMALANEVWRTFLVIMIIALMAEALLCLPSREDGEVAAAVAAQTTTAAN